MEPGKARLWAELALLFGVLPLVTALVLPQGSLLPVLLAATGLGVWLLHRTPGFRWRELLRGRVEGRIVAIFAAGAAVLVLGLAMLVTGDPLQFARTDPGYLALVLVFYPVLSALPQEVLFRALWFRRYGAVLPGGAAGLVLNAAAFALAHVIYASWIVTGLSFAGGLVFGWAYQRRGSFPLAVVLHAVAGQILFALGLGTFFLAGGPGRPF